MLGMRLGIVMIEAHGLENGELINEAHLFLVSSHGNLTKADEECFSIHGFLYTDDSELVQFKSYHYLENTNISQFVTSDNTT